VGEASETDPTQIWMDGTFPAPSTLSLYTHSFHYGTAVFEGIRYHESFDGRPALFRLTSHLERFDRGARGLGMEVPYSHAQLRAAMWRMIAAAGAPSGSLRPIAFYGDEGRGLGARNPVRVAILQYRSGSTRPPSPVSLCVSPMRSECFPGSDLKLTGFYARRFLALEDARKRGFDDGVLVDHEGHVAEATTANVFAVRGHTLVTPSLTGACIPGITRDTIMRLARAMGLAVTETAMSMESLYEHSEVFLTSTGGGIRPVARFEATHYAAPGPVTQTLMERYGRVVRGQLEEPAEEHRAWLDFGADLVD
jgi:branched-chain amino acid aminotransferase